MSADPVAELATKVPPPAQLVERLKFHSRECEDVRASDLVNGLVGVTWALDLGVSGRDEHHEREIRDGLSTAARLLAEQLQARIEFDYKPRRREVAR